ncbi:MAG: hypothetical protein RL330_940 [Actinomycetota bacterium]|jgi:hypothetical protein
MLRFRAPLVLLGAGTLLLSACGSGLEALTLARTGRDASKLAAGANESADVMWAPYMEYEVVGDLPDLGDAARAWKVSAPSLSTSKNRLADLARHFGVEGEPVANKEDRANWTIGLDPETWSGMNMYVSDSEVWWSYTSEALTRTVTPGCVEPGLENASPDDSGVSTPCADIPEPKKPENLPSVAEAEAAMRDLLEAGGEDPSEWRLSATVDEWGAWVQAIRLVGGLESSYMWWMSFGEDAEVTNASGTFATFRSNGSYPLADTAAAVDRLATWMFAARAEDLEGGADIADISGALTKESVVGEGEPVDPSEGSGSGSSPGSDGDDVPAPDEKPIEPMPIEPVEPMEPVVVEITGARLGLMAAWLEDGRVMLLPAYIYTNADGDVGSVYAIVDEYLGFADPTDTTLPGPTDSTDVPAPPPLIDEKTAATLVGLSEEDAVANAEANGWIVRVAERDGEKFPLTADWVENRVNLVVDNDVVIGVTVG